MNITIKTIPQKDHRYETIGDYWFTGDKPTNSGDLEVRVSDVGDWRYELLVALHELVEVALLKHKGVSEPVIMAFDEAFEAKRARGEVGVNDEPGDASEAPYRDEHRFAENLERLMAQRLGVNWDDYDKHLEKHWETQRQSVKAGGQD